MLRIIDENGREVAQILEKLFPKVLEISAIQYVVDWEKVPKKYNYWAVDKNGEAYYYGDKPIIDKGLETWIVKSYMFEEDVNYDCNKYNNHYNWEDSLCKRKQLLHPTIYKPNWKNFPEMHYWAIDVHGAAYYFRTRPSFIIGKYWTSGDDCRDNEFVMEDYDCRKFEESLQQNPNGYCPNWSKYPTHTFWAVDNNEAAYYYTSKPILGENGIWQEDKRNMTMAPIEDREFAIADKELREGKVVNWRIPLRHRV